ncbi:hypothetical protein F4805DRAFT_150731 [Annulohypoxylon moriforme]|nr:hypothetical protein F4805DRAFT_150731 [Annulohypoxylon moriforme]
MLADILQNLANDTSDSDGVEQLVVTALGSCGQHYICWKTHSGEYRQRSNGLPKPLQDWLFPADGSTRDFETLQVILSGENTFWASDRNGEVRSEPPGPQQRLRRALTLSGDSFAPSPRQQTGRPRGLSRGEADERPRSSILPSGSPTSTVDHLPGPHLKPPASHSRSSSADKLRKIALVPLAFNQQKRSWAMRPRSLVYGHDDLGTLKEQPSPNRRSAPSAAAKSPRTAFPVIANANDTCTCGCHSDGSKGAHKQVPSKAEARVEEKAEAKPKSRYADACVQTDPTPDLEPDTAEDEFPHRRRRHHRRESTSSITSTADSYRSSYASSKRSSFDTVTTQPDAAEYLESKGIGDVGRWQQMHQPQAWDYVPNPIMMGRMQDYFRSSNYTLGAALSS